MEATQLLQMTKKEQMLITTSSNSHEPLIDNSIHRMDKTQITTLGEKLKVWGYVMTQYNLKPGLRKFGNRGHKAAVKELMQLHAMDTCRQAITRTADVGAVVTVVSEGEKDRRRKGACLHKWSTAKELHAKEGGCIINGVDRVDIPHSVDSGP